MVLTQPRDFYIDHVEDLRADTNIIGQVMTGMMNRGKARLFPAPSSQYLSGWFSTVMSRRPNEKPVILQILELTCTEEIDGLKEYAKCRMLVRFLTPAQSGYTVLGDFSAATIGKSSIDVTHMHDNHIRTCFANVLNQLVAHGWQGSPVTDTHPIGDFRLDFPWPKYRSSFADSLPEGLYANIAAFRNAQPMPPMEYKREVRKSEERSKLTLKFATGPKAGKLVPTGKFYVRRGEAFVRSGEIFISLVRDRNGYYLLVPGNAANNNAMLVGALAFGLLGALVASSISSTSDPVKTTRYYIDMRVGKAVSEYYWSDHQKEMASKKPCNLVIYSRDRYLVSSPITLAAMGDTSQHMLKSNAMKNIILKQNY